MRPGSHFVFTIETCPEEATGKGFKLLRNGRFGYSQSYMTRLLSALKDQIDIVL